MSVFDQSAFADPPNEFRPLQIVHGLDRFMSDPEGLTGEEGIDEHLEKLVEVGTGGIVANVGFKDYLVSPRQWEIFRYGMRKADELGLVLWLYDENVFPSGTAGGLVTRSHPEYAALGLACYKMEVEGPTRVVFARPPSCREFVWAGSVAGVETATSDRVTDLSDKVDEWDVLHWTAPPGKWTVIYLAQRVRSDYKGRYGADDRAEFDRYINVLRPEAVREFLRVTHEQYYRETPPKLWSKIVAVFTDEPSFKTFGTTPVSVPWVAGLLGKFKAMKGYDLRPYLFELFVSETDEACYVRQDYYDVITRLYADAYFAQIRRWCQEHGIASSGHVLWEENIIDHVAYQGSLYAVIREMDLPGIDMLTADPQEMLGARSMVIAPYMAAKQVSSVAHITGRQQVHSESSDFEQRSARRRWLGQSPRTATLEERLGQGNLLYVLGINQTTSYYGWDEIGEEGWRQYNDYMGRLASLLTGGKHVCDVAVLYPVRTVWANHVPPKKVPRSWEEKHASALQKLTRSWEEKHASALPWAKRVSQEYPDLVRHLLRNQIDLDIIDEKAVVEAESREGRLCIADEAYRVIVLPPLHALTLGTARALAAFCRAGGLLLSLGPLPELAESPNNAEALRKEMAALFSEGGPGRIVPMEQVPAYLRENVAMDLALGQPNRDILYTHRRLEGRDLYFIINNAPTNTVIAPKLRKPGPYTLYRPLTGGTESVGDELELALDGYEGVFVVCEPTG